MSLGRQNIEIAANVPIGAGPIDKQHCRCIFLKQTGNEASADSEIVGEILRGWGLVFGRAVT